MEIKREQWGSRNGFVLAAAGSAIGLGNIWKFPYLIGENGGAAFILLYLFFIVTVGLPVVMAEILIGRTAQKNPVGSFRELSKGNPFWIGVGLLGVITGFIILSYYNVIAGWSLGYVVESIKGSFQGINNPENAGVLFDNLSSKTHWAVSFQALFMILTIMVIYFGVNKGIEKASKLLMPVLLFFILILIIRGVTLEGAKTGVLYLLKPDFSVITVKTVFIALGQAFFSLSLGMGALLTYGSYMSKKENLPVSAISIVGLDTAIAVLAGFMIFPALFAFGLKPDEGPALIYNVLPVMFNSLPGGFYFRIIFFILLCVAALTSTISLLEVITAFVVDEFQVSRKKVAIFLGFIVFLLGVPSALSYGVLAEFKIFGKTFFGMADFISANIFLPIGGVCIALFVGWKWGMKNVMSNIKEGGETVSETLLNIWVFIIKFISPLFIFIILVYKLLLSLGILK